jgi:5-methylcytosine-specific restriction endonuclease McrA
VRREFETRQRYVHILSNVDAEARKATCSECGPVTIVHQGKGRYKCTVARKAYHKPYRAYVDKQCAKCNFVAVDPCQLDVDHKDGNHQNNELSNLWTLCANCHRLKTLRPDLF